MKAKDESLHQLFPYDKASNSYVIEVSLDGYEDIFNEWDPAPLKRRDLDPDLTYFLEACSDDIPLRHAISIQFVLEYGERENRHEDRIVQAIRNYYRFSMNSITKDIRQIKKRIAIYSVMAFGFLISAVLGTGIEGHNVLLQTGTEGLFIGGWVFLWEAISLIFFSMRDSQVEFRKADRFFKASYQFVIKDHEVRS